LEYLTIAAAEQGLTATIDPWNPGFHPGLLATVTMAEDGVDDLRRRLVPALRTRQTVRGFHDRLLPVGLLESLSEVADNYEPHLDVVTDRDAVDRIGSMVEEGNRAAFGLPAMRRELSEMVSWARDKNRRGMSIESMFPDRELPNVRSASDAILTMDGADEARRIGDWYREAPALLIVSTMYDGPEAWIASGRLAVALMLEASLVGVSHCISAAPVEVPNLVPRLRAEIQGARRPQVLMRIGMASKGGELPRIETEELFG